LADVKKKTDTDCGRREDSIVAEEDSLDRDSVKTRSILKKTRSIVTA
jgi:hypothetical protein